MKCIAILIVGLALCSCATHLTEKGSMVKRSTPSEVRGYTYLGAITTSSPLTGVLRNEGYQNALNSAFNQAAIRGATHIVIDPDSEASYWTTSETVRAEAYRKP
jgi:hypothetical protein